jgi:hypothetical protein
LSMEFCVNIILLTVKLSHRWRERPPSVWHGGVVAGFWFLGLDVLPGGRVHMMGYLHVWFHAVACMVLERPGCEWLLMSRTFWLKPLGPLSFSWRRTKRSSRDSSMYLLYCHLSLLKEIVIVPVANQILRESIAGSLAYWL